VGSLITYGAPIIALVTFRRQISVADIQAVAGCRDMTKY
jgi:hypothetical protein